MNNQAVRKKDRKKEYVDRSVAMPLVATFCCFLVVGLLLPAAQYESKGWLLYAMAVASTIVLAATVHVITRLWVATVLMAALPIAPIVFILDSPFTLQLIMCGSWIFAWVIIAIWWLTRLYKD